MIIQMMDSTLESTRHYWRREMKLPEDIVTDPRPWIAAVADREDAKTIIDNVAKNMADRITSTSKDLNEYLIDLAVRHYNWRPDLVAAVRSSGETND